MVPILRFLSIYKNMPDSSPKSQATIKALEHLVINNVILPARASFISSKSWKKTESGAQSLLSAEVLLAPLAKNTNLDVEEFSLIKNPNVRIPAVSMLFSIAIQSLPRITPKQRSLEDSWLQHLFIQLGKNPHSNLTAGSKQYISALNWMLREAIDHKVRLDGSIFEAILSQVINISDEELNLPDASIYWALISLCLELDPSIFIASSLVDKGTNGNPTPNKYLAFLLSRLTGWGWKSSARGDANYEFELVKVILPLVEAFANARDLITFIFHWRQQMALRQQQPLHTLHIAAPHYYRARTIWEDERLILFVGRLIDTSLTSGQIHSLFEGVLINLPPALRDVKDSSRSAADLVFLDCLVGGLSKESNLDQLAETAQSIYLAISSIVSGMTAWAGENTWRLWRILATFNVRWSPPLHSMATKQAAQLAMSRAAETVIDSIHAKPKDAQSDYARELYAFSFLLKIAPLQNREPKHENRLVSFVIETILKCRQSSCDSLGPQAAGTSRLKEFAAQWNGQIDTITSVDILILGYCAQILTFSTILT